MSAEDADIDAMEVCVSKEINLNGKLLLRESLVNVGFEMTYVVIN